MNITTTLKPMVLRYEYTSVCSDLKPTIVKTEDGMCQRQFELIGYVDYTQDEARERFNLNSTVVKWMDLFMDNGKETMAVVLQQGEPLYRDDYLQSTFDKWATIELKMQIEEYRSQKKGTMDQIKWLKEAEAELARRSK